MNLEEKRRLQREVIRETKDVKWFRQERYAKDIGYLSCVKDLIMDPVVQRMDRYIQHGTTTTLHHCMDVSYMSYRVSKWLRWDARTAARAGLLHDLFLYDWHTHTAETGNHFHGFTHPQVALHNADHYFCLTDAEKDIIVTHMWPMTLIPPKYREGYVVVCADKYLGLIETLRRMTPWLFFFSKSSK